MKRRTEIEKATGEFEPRPPLSVNHPIRNDSMTMTGYSTSGAEFPVPTVFQNEQFGSVRVVQRDDEPWFVAKDIADGLGYASTNMTTVFKSVPREWKGSNPIATLGGEQELLCISEQGLYFFLARSDKPTALPFQKWLAGDVVPTIRKHGMYATPQTLEAMLADPDTTIRILTELKSERERRIEAERTKAQIGSRREATAMATASAATKEANRLRNELGRSIEHATILAVYKITGIDYAWRPLRRWCRKHGVKPSIVPDPRYGEVKAWPAVAWKAVHGLDLQMIFAVPASEA